MTRDPCSACGNSDGWYQEGRHLKCHPCRVARSAAWYAANREHALAAARARVAKNGRLQPPPFWRRLYAFGLRSYVLWVAARFFSRAAEAGLLRCELTGRTLTLDTASPDHITPKSKGGTNGLANLRWLHVDVNKARLATDDAGFVQMCQEVARYMENYK